MISSTGAIIGNITLLKVWNGRHCMIFEYWMAVFTFAPSHMNNWIYISNWKFWYEPVRSWVDLCDWYRRRCDHCGLILELYFSPIPITTVSLSALRVQSPTRSTRRRDWTMAPQISGWFPSASSGSSCSPK